MEMGGGRWACAWETMIHDDTYLYDRLMWTFTAYEIGGEGFDARAPFGGVVVQARRRRMAVMALAWLTSKR